MQKEYFDYNNEPLFFEEAKLNLTFQEALDDINNR